MSKNIKQKMFTSTFNSESPNEEDFDYSDSNFPICRQFKVPQAVSPNGTIILRPWQAEAQESKLSTDKTHFIVNAPTGGGKSKLICSISLNRLKRNPKLKVVICVPQKSIGGGFTGGNDGERYIINGKEERWFVEKQNNFCTGQEEQKTKGLVEFLTETPLKSHIKKKWKSRARVVICTHATLAKAFDQIGGLELSDIDLWIDEAHHISIDDFEANEANKLGQAVSYFFENSERNLSVNMATATLFRADKKTIIPKGHESECESYKLPYDKHFEENCEYLKSFGYDLMLDQEGWFESIKKIFKDEVKKTIVFVPHPNTRMSSGQKLEEVQKILESIAGKEDCKYSEDEHGCYWLDKDGKKICVVDLVDDRDTKLRDKRDQFVRDYPEKVDVILNINKFTEGADWPHANRAIIVGRKGSLVQMVQIIGRLFRDHKSKEDKPVEVIQLFSWVDKHSFDDEDDEDGVKDNINNYVKAIYASLILESIIDPPDIKVKDTRKKKDGEKKERDTSLKDILTDELTESEYHELIEGGIDELIKFGEDKPFDEVEYLECAKGFIEQQLVDNEDLLEFSEDISKFILEICRKRNCQVMLENYPNVSDVDFEAVEKMNPASFLCAYTNNICGIKTLKEFRHAFDELERIWNEKYEIIKEYVQENNKIPSFSTKYKGKNIGTWCNRQRVNKKKGSLTQDRISKLEEIKGWVWGNDDVWNENYKLLKEFVREFNRVPGPSVKYKNKCIGYWVNKQNVNEKEGSLSQDRINKLKEIKGWHWYSEIEMKREEVWNENYKLLKEYVQEFNKPPSRSKLYKKTKYQNELAWEIKPLKFKKNSSFDWEKTHKIFIWIESQRGYRKALSQDRINKLEEINGWSWKSERIK